MKLKHPFFISVLSLAVPVALQSMLQSSFSIVDQVMIGQLGSVSVAAVGIAGKFAWIFSVLVSAVGAVAGIMISQYLGQKNKFEVRRSFNINLILSMAIALIFTALCFLFPERIMELYTKDALTVKVASSYLRIIGGTFVPMAGATLLSTLFRCVEKADLPLYASIFSALLNTFLNYILIFGKCGFSELGADGAAIATLISQWANFFIMFVMIKKCSSHLNLSKEEKKERTEFNLKQYKKILFPILVCEFAWSLGENVYVAIYGHLGTDSAAAMTLINPVQGILIGALSGISQAASIIVGKKLGNKSYDRAYSESKRLMLYGLVGSLLLCVSVIAVSGLYVEIYRVDEQVKLLTKQILFAFALISPFKVLNMILGGGIIRSGGKTKYAMIIDLIGTWGFGVTLGLFSAFVLKLSVPFVYFILSLEEIIRFLISLYVFKTKRWMSSLKSKEPITE